MKNFLGWILGSVMIVFGVLMMATMFLPGLTFAFIGLTLIPTFRAFLIEKTHTTLNTSAKQGAYAVLWLIFSGSLVYSSMSLTQASREAQVKIEQANQIKLEQQRKERLAKLQKAREGRTKYFNNHKESVIKEIKSLKEQKKYIEAIKKCNLYIQTKDNELIALKQDIEAIQKKIELDKRTKKILADLKKVPVKQINKNYNLYKELVGMHPKNTTYQKKMKHYEKKVVDREAKIAAEKIFYGNKPVRSGWDGSYVEVERYLKSVAHDPDSIDIENCTEPYRTDEGWAVLCKYRGKNAFGGMILKHNWFIIRQNSVAGVKGPDAYSIN